MMINQETSLPNSQIGNSKKRYWKSKRNQACEHKIGCWLFSKNTDKRAAQTDGLKAARSAVKTAFFILDRLVIKDKHPDSQSVTCRLKTQSGTAVPGHSDEENEISFGT